MDCVCLDWLDLVGIWLEFGWIWLGFGGDLVGIWWGFGWNLVGIWWGFGWEFVGIWLEFGMDLVGSARIGSSTHLVSFPPYNLLARSCGIN